MNHFQSHLSRLREYLSTPSNTSTFTKTGEITPEEFVEAGDYLVYKFPTWSWAPAAPLKKVAYLPEDKQYLVLRNAPCHSRVDDTFSSWNPGEAKGECEDEWEDNTPQPTDGETLPVAKVKTVDESGVEEEEDDEDEDDDIPDEEEDDDEAIIKETPKSKVGGRGVKA